MINLNPARAGERLAPARQPAAFTLIELLVVTAIVVLAISLGGARVVAQVMLTDLEPATPAVGTYDVAQLNAAPQFPGTAPDGLN
ncbi:MAG: prepilin-type N-terminal cleavage/methylation domain-containing protein, partial [Verrucomicrobiota bacterium]